MNLKISSAELSKCIIALTELLNDRKMFLKKVNLIEKLDFKYLALEKSLEILDCLREELN